MSKIDNQESPNAYEQEAVMMGGTHKGPKGHVYMSLGGFWFVYKLGAGWQYTKHVPEKMQRIRKNNDAVLITIIAIAFVLVAFGLSILLGVL